MAVTYGFYNSQNGDRKYDAVQFGEIFDGIINDGVYQSIGSAFLVKPTTGTSVSVGTGRAWFNHTWIKNDSEFQVLLNSAHPIYDRIDAVVFDINSASRINSITVVQGEPAETPVKPQIGTGSSHQYPIAYITVKKAATSIAVFDINYVVGTKDCPFVTGPLTVMTMERFVEAWSSEWNDWMSNAKNEYSSNLATSKSQFEDWFRTMQVNLNSNTAANLQNQITELTKTINLMASGGYSVVSIEDSAGRPVMDNNGAPIQGQRKYNGE